MDEFRQAKLRLENMDQMERRFQKDYHRLVDWDDPADVAFFKGERRRTERVKLLDRLVKDRRCPKCASLVINPRGWILNRRRTAAICRQCFHAIFSLSDVHPREDTIMLNCFPAVAAYTLDSDQLTKCRMISTLSIREFAHRCGWSRAYQERLESGKIQSVSTDARAKIEKVLNGMGVRLISS